MPENLRAWALTVCTACVLGAVLTMLFPEGGSKKLLNMIVSMLLLCVIGRPAVSLGQWFLNWDTDRFQVSQYQNEELEQSMTSNAADIYAAYLTENLERVLDGSDIAYQNIIIRMDISENGSISIGQVEVIVQNAEAEKAETIKHLLTGYIGLEPVVTTVEQ